MDTKVRWTIILNLLCAIVWAYIAYDNYSNSKNYILQVALAIGFIFMAIEMYFSNRSK